MKERLQKVLAAAGVASRRKSEQLIAAGNVTVNGRVASVGESADPSVDVIAVNGLPVTLDPGRVYIALNKPRGFVTSRRSTHGEQTVMDLLSGLPHLFPVGRLDRDTSGLLLLTDDGDWGNIVTHPRYTVEKEYTIHVRGTPTHEALERMRAGVQLPDGVVTAPARVRVLDKTGPDVALSVTVIEGKKRQIRLMAEAIGHPVHELRRVRVGPVELGDLRVGAWRHLRITEIEGIRTHGRDDFARDRTPAAPSGRDRRAGRGRQIHSG